MEIVKKNKKKHASVWHFSQSNLQLFLFFFLSLFPELLIYQAAKLFDSTGRWTLSVSFLGEVSIPFSLFLRIYMIILALGKL